MEHLCGFAAITDQVSANDLVMGVLSGDMAPIPELAGRPVTPIGVRATGNAVPTAIC